MDNLEIYYKKAARQLRSGEALFGKYGALAQNKGVFPSDTALEKLVFIKFGDRFKIM